MEKNDVKLNIWSKMEQRFCVEEKDFFFYSFFKTLIIIPRTNKVAE